MCCLPCWNQIAATNRVQVGYRRRNRSANGCPPIFADCESDEQRQIVLPSILESSN
ncbi:MAG: hypothetical protein LBK82_04670 [Planctomycetaceae bacterium]|nr:hypothetical protein [Planctomycetaceae bacterium]